MNPKFRGYCGDCLKKLKKNFDIYLERYNKAREEHENYTGKDQLKANDKLRLMKNKVAQYDIKLSEKEMVNVIGKFEELLNGEENRTFAEFKVTV